jgi:phosphonate transport system substrate-binding protein
MNRFFGILVLFTLIGGLSGCGVSQSVLVPTPTPTPALTPTPAPIPTPMPCPGKTLTFGEISDDPTEVIESVTPFANYIAGRLAPYGVMCGRVVVRGQIEEMIKLIQDGEVDIIQDSAYPAWFVSSATGAKPILRRWRYCTQEYYSVIFTTKDSGITSIDDLRGKMVAMDNIYSTTGFALPVAYLIDHGLNVALKDSYKDPVGENEIGIIFSYDDINTISLVDSGKVSAGATDDYNFNKHNPNNKETETPGKYVKLAVTSPVMRQVALVRPDMASGLQAAIIDEMSNAHLNKVGLDAMLASVGTCKYDEFPEGIDATFAQMQAMHNKIIVIPGWLKYFFKQDKYLAGAWG